MLTRLIGLTLLLAMLMGFEYLLLEYRLEQASNLRDKTWLRADALRARLEGELQAVMCISSGLSGYLAVHRGAFDPGETRAILAQSYRQSRHVRSFGIAIDYRLGYVFPQDDDIQALGLDYRNQIDQWPLIQRSVETRSPLLMGPFPKSLAGVGLIIGFPIFTEGHYWGLLSTVLDDASLFSAAGMKEFDENYQYALRGKHSLGANGEMILGAAKLFADPNAAIMEVTTAGGSWQLAVKPRMSAPGNWHLRALAWLFAGLYVWQTLALIGLNRRLAELALYDRLTGLPTRHLFLDRLKQMIRHAKRNGGQFSVLFIDLDGLRQLNDRHGHKVGDMMLEGIGKRLIGSIRHCDTVTRWGGDEFVVLLDTCPFEQATIIAENLRHKIEFPVSYSEDTLRIGASLGVATYPKDGCSLAALLKVAAVRMIADKKRRKAET